ncbi:MAG TPA: MBL fold metallo-hydrolase [Rhodanobacteraceae bacterium]|nr:MBL fold metallo-hydrolase [Rhodanobacteraceae bacterium]
MNRHPDVSFALADHGIHVVDTGFHRPRFDAAYLIIHAGRAAFVDCGTRHSVPRLLDALTTHGLGPSDVDWLILTHVHLDHAGGAGELMTHLPNAKLALHPRGARHMIDPSKLWAGASAVYGEAVMRRDYGELVPVPAARVVEADDEYVVDLAGRRLRCLDTPGHARHHNAIFDEASGLVFTGDVFGLSYREFDSAQGPFILPTTSPVQFEPDALHASIRRIVSLAPVVVCPTHFGPVGAVARLADDLHWMIDAMVAAATRLAEHSDRHAQLVEALSALYCDRANAHGSPLSTAAIRELLAVDIELNAQGLEVWLNQQRKATA